MRVFNPTGGMVYHVRARRFQNSLWLPFRQQIARALDDWQPSEKELLILGPSGGYTLSTDFLERFERLWLFDPDRLAPVFFRQTHGRLQAKWSHSDLIFEKKQYAPDRLRVWLEEHPNSAVLFSNLLGQLPLVQGDVQALRSWWKTIESRLIERSWMSYHDLFSFQGACEPPPRWQEGPLVPQLVNWAKQRQISLELIDHGTSELFPRQRTCTWRFSPRRTHIVGTFFQRRN